MLQPRLTNCKGCADIPDLLRRIDCKLAELGSNLYNNVVFMLNKPIEHAAISELLVYKRVLTYRYCDTHYAKDCHGVDTETIASKVIRLTAGCVPHCGEPTVCEITTCPITPCPNPTTTTTSTSSSSTTTTTTLAPTTTTTTTLNCNFSGVIDCNITTTTTTTAPPTTTTTTSYFPDPFGVPCIWSTNGGNPGLVGVYDFDTNTATDVLVPNDFNETVGIERPLCATEDKLWLVSIVDQGSSRFQNKVYIREWDIDGTTPNAPTLTYVREITVPTGQFSSSVNLGGTSVWAITAKDNDTLIIGTGYRHAPAPQEGTGGEGRMYLHEFSIAAAGDITIAETDISSAWAASNSQDSANKISNITYTNSGQLVMGYRLDLNPDGSGFAGAVGNYIKVFPVTPSNPEFELYNLAIASRILQNSGYPEFTNDYTGVKDAPFWGVNGLAQVLHPETLEVYTIDQLPPYNLTLATSVTSSNDWLSSATHCSNIEFENANDCGGTYFPPFFFDAEGNPATPFQGGVYDPTPQTFTFEGMTCTATLAGNVDAFTQSPLGTTQMFLGQASNLSSPCSGLRLPESNYPNGPAVSNKVNGDNFSITINFPVPVNNIPIRAGVLNSNPDGTDDGVSDVYYVETNGGTPTLSITQGCYVQADGNRLWGGVQNPYVPAEAPLFNEGDGEFKVTAPASYTSMTIYGNAPSCGQLLLGCPDPALNCNRIYGTLEVYDCNDNPGVCAPQNNFPEASDPRYRILQSHDVVTGNLEPIVLPPGSAFTVPNSCVSENYLVNTISIDDDQGQWVYKYVRLYYDTSATGVPENVSWDGVIYELDPNDLPDCSGTCRFQGGVSTINDDTFVLNYRLSGQQGKRVFEASFVPGSNILAVSLKFIIPEPFNGGSEHVVTLNQDGTPSKYIGLRSNEPIVVSQFDYATGNFEGETMLTGPGLAENYRTVGDMSVIGEFLYITARRLDTNTTELWKVSFDTLEWSVAESDDSYNGGSAGSKPSCRISDGFNFSGTTTTTTTNPNTTTTTTTVPPGVRTIFTRFYPIVTNN